MDFLQPGATDDPEFLKTLAEGDAIKVSVADGSVPTAVTLTLTK